MSSAGERARERARQRIRDRQRREALAAPRLERRAREDAALWEQVAAGRRVPEPTRITCALDLRGLQGPQVDRDCGAEEPAVDEWEAGTRVPTPDQLLALAALTEMPWQFFLGPRLPEPTGVTVCWSGRLDPLDCGPMHGPPPPFDPLT